MIKFVTSRVQKSNILSIDKGSFAEIVNVTDEYIQLRLVFNINLVTPDNNAANYKKVVVSLKREGYSVDTEPVIDSSARAVKINVNPTDFSLVRPLTRRHPSIGRIGVTDKRSPPVSIPATAMQRIAKNYSMIKNLKKSKNTQDKITSCNVFINDYIKEALNSPYETIDLATPEIINLDQGKRLHQDKIQRNSIYADINKEFVSPVSLIRSGDPENHSDLSKKFVDYFIHDAPSPPKDFIDTLTFFKPTKNLRFLNELEIPCHIKLPIKHKDANISVNFELYEYGAIRAIEVDFASLDIGKLLEAYKVIDGSVIVNAAVKNADSAFTKNYLTSFTYDDFDVKKVKLLNVYTKSFFNHGSRLANYRLIGSITPQKINEVTAISLLEKNVESLQIVRVVPVTDIGESSDFTDVVIGESMSTNISQNFILIARQGDANTIIVDIHNVDTTLDFLKIYRRRCRNSIDNNFKLIANYKKIKSINFTWFDAELVPGEVYEYYAVVEDSEGVKQLSNYSIVEFKKMLRNKSQGVTISDVVKSPDSISFLITTLQKKNSDNSTMLYSSAVNAAYGSVRQNNSIPALASNFAGIVPSVLSALPEKTFEPPNPVNYKNLFFHLVSRIDMLSGEKESFDLVPDGRFTDDLTSRRQDYVTRLVPGRKYVYEIQTFVRDPLTIKKDFIVSGEKNNTAWFNRPYKWKNPTVLNTGILYSDDENGVPEITNFDNHTAEFVGTTVTSAIGTPEISKYNLINPIAERISRSVIKINWELPQKSYYDSFVVVKVLNGIRHILGKTRTDTFYHKLTSDDLGCIYYEITCLLSDFSIDRTYYSDNLIVEEDLSYKGPRSTVKL